MSDRHLPARWCRLYSTSPVRNVGGPSPSLSQNTTSRTAEIQVGIPPAGVSGQASHLHPGPIEPLRATIVRRRRVPAQCGNVVATTGWWARATGRVLGLAAAAIAPNPPYSSTHRCDLWSGLFPLSDGERARPGVEAGLGAEPHRLGARASAHVDPTCGNGHRYDAVAFSLTRPYAAIDRFVQRVLKNERPGPGEMPRSHQHGTRSECHPLPARQQPERRRGNGRALPRRLVPLRAIHRSARSDSVG